jgi:hypothetical protein
VWVDLGVGVGLRSGRGLILPARGDFARGGLQFWSRRGGGAVGVVVGLPIWVGCGDLRFGLRRGGGAVGGVWLWGCRWIEEGGEK